MNTAPTLGMLVADEALHVITTATHTRYQHDADIDEATGTYDVDCSGFVSYLLGKVAPKHLHLIPAPPAQTRLYAADYHRFFASQPGGVLHVHQINQPVLPRS
jgi:hypothetical protein